MGTPFCFEVYYDLLNTPSACDGVSTRKRGLGGNDVSPQVKSDFFYQF